MNKTRTAVVCTLLAAIAGCSTPEVRNTYEDAGRSGRDVAVLFTPKEDAYSDQRPRAFFSAVDGKHYGTFMAGYPAATRVVPGAALIKVNCFDPKLPKMESFLLFRTTLQAGHYYELACDRISASALDRGTSYESIRHLLPDAIHAELAQ